MTSSAVAGVELMEATGVGAGRLKEWSDLFSQSADYSLQNVVVGLQYLLLFDLELRAACFAELGFSPVVGDVYKWMVERGHVNYNRLIKYGFVVVEEDECFSDDCEDVLSIVLRGPYVCTLSAADMKVLMACEMRVGPKCISQLTLGETKRVNIAAEVGSGDGMQLIRCAVQEVVTAGVDMDKESEVDELNWFIVDDVLDDFAEAKGLYGLGVVQDVEAEHCFGVHYSADQVPESSQDGYCYLEGFKPELHSAVYVGLKEKPFLKSILPWYALAVRYSLAEPVDIVHDGDRGHFSISQGDPIQSLKAMLAVARDNPSVRVGGGLTSQEVVGSHQVPCECGAQSGYLIPDDVVVEGDCTSGTVVAAWLTSSIDCCKYSLFDPGVYNVEIHRGRLAVETSVALVTIPKGMQLMLNGGCMLDTRDVVGSVRLLCIGGFVVLSEHESDKRTVQVIVGDTDAFSKWFKIYVDDSPHFPGLVEERGVGVYVWTRDSKVDRGVPSTLWSGLIDDVAVVLLTGGLRVGVPFNLRLSTSGYVDVVRTEYGSAKIRRLPVCGKEFDIPDFPRYVGVDFTRWLHTQMSSDRCVKCSTLL